MGRRTDVARVAFPLVAWAIGAAVFFRDQLTSGFNLVMGDDGDARLCVALHEHWFDVLRGRAGWNDPTFFHPVKDVLGYTDTFFVNHFVYVPLRLVGMDAFLAFQVTLLLMSAIGFMALYVVLRAHLQVRRVVAVGGCLVYCFGNNLAIKVGQPQHLTSWWTPLCVLAGLTAVRHRTRLVRVLSAQACGALAMAIVYSNFYAGWTSLLELALVGVGLAVVRPSRSLRFVVGLARDRWREVLLAVAAGVPVAIAAVRTYLPILDQFGGRPYDEVELYAARPADLINVSPQNFIWGPFLRWVFGADDPRLANGERALAITPLLVLAALVLVVIVVMLERRGEGRVAVTARTAFAVSAIGVAVFLALLPISFEGHSGWYPFWAFVPGGSAIRATGRLQVFGSQLMAVGVAVLFSRVLDLRGVRPRRHGPAITAAVVAVLGLLCVEQLHLGPTSLVDRTAQRTQLRRVPPVPRACSSFFIVSPGPPINDFSLQIDAILISQSTGIPTLNGYSGQIPPGWKVKDVQLPGYVEHAREWAESNGVATGLCSYDRTTHTWQTAPFSSPTAAFGQARR